ncbi:MAG: type VI secretion system baseplate subunit TssF [Trichloromonadaceae bacterium]
MSDYFDAEMRLLQEVAQEFARAYPEKAGMLNLQEVKDRDPYVERLLEGMAFLTAQVKQRIDDDVPEISEALLSHLWPHFLRPLPSLSIVQFAHRQGQLQQSRILKKGTALLSPPVGGDRTICRFRTTSEVELHPLRLSRFSLGESGKGGCQLKLGFQLDPGIAADSLGLKRLKIYLQADPAVALGLYHALTCQVAGVQLSCPGLTTPQSLGGQSALRPCHLAAEELLAPASGRSFHGFHLLQEYFCFREKYQFVAIEGLEKIRWPANCSEFSIDIQLRNPLDKDFQLTRDNFRLFCTPAINLFDSSSEPISLDHRLTDYPLVADASAPEGVQVYSVDQVTGISAAGGKRSDYSCLPAFTHRQLKERFFQVNRKGEEGLRPATHISVGGLSDFARETLSCRITASNGDYPRRFLQVGSLQVPAPDFPSSVQFSNITRPTRLLPPPRRRDYRLALISHLTINHNSLTSLEAFKQLLSLYDWTEQPQNQRRIEGIRDIAMTAVDRIKRGALLRGLEIRLTLQAENYLSEADVHLFGTVLHHFLSMYASVNAFVQTRIVLHPSNREMTWEPLLGENFLL